MIDCRCVFKRLAGRALLAGIDLQVRRGETLVVCGPSGTGKTTLLRAINGLEPIDSGHILVEGQPVQTGRGAARQLKGRVGMLFQHFNLFEHLSVLDNICLAPRQVLGQARAAAETRARALLAELDLADHADQMPAQLSGGEKQRVALARCLAMDPKAMLLDEPTSALDPERSEQIVQLLARLKAANVATVVVSHDRGFAYRVADRMVSLADGHLVELAHDRSCCADVLPRLAQAARGIAHPSAHALVHPSAHLLAPPASLSPAFSPAL
jgi:ABC-type polar amino acid transport system ATPase subunit